MHPIKIRNENLTVKLISYGARLVDIRLASIDFPLILGYPNIADYRKDNAYLGAIIGRVANRIQDAQSKIRGVMYTFDTNECSKPTLHVDQKLCFPILKIKIQLIHLSPSFLMSLMVTWVFREIFI